jgi:hypothetical protein
MKRAFLALVVGLASTSAIAEEQNKTAPGETAAPQDAAPAPAEATPAPSAAAPEQNTAPAAPNGEAKKPKAARAPAAKPKAARAPAVKPQPAAGMSQSKFLGALYSEIARRRPEKNSAGPGVVQASFRVNAAGKIDNVSIKNSTSPAHAEVVKRILTKVQAPPPPSGVFEGAQEFKFH